MIDIAVGNPAQWPVGPDQIKDTLDALQVHCEALEAVGNLSGDRATLEAADLLEVGELRHLHPVQPDLPAEAPCAQGRGLPVVFDEPNVVHEGVDTDCAQRPEVQLLDIEGRRFYGYLVLVVVLQAKRVVAVTTVCRPPAGLYVGRRPGLGTDRAQKSCRVKRPCAHFHVVRLQDDAASFCPVLLELQNQVLKAQALRGGVGGHRGRHGPQGCRFCR